MMLRILRFHFTPNHQSISSFDSNIIRLSNTEAITFQAMLTLHSTLATLFTTISHYYCDSGKLLDT